MFSFETVIVILNSSFVCSSLLFWLTTLLIYLRKTLENKIIVVPDIASSMKPLAHKTPIDAVHHNVAAVVNPLIFIPSFNITPAPKKHIPVTIC